MRGGCLQEVPNIEIGLGNFCYFGKLVAGERWLQLEVQLYYLNSQNFLPFKKKQKENVCNYYDIIYASVPHL